VRRVATIAALLLGLATAAPAAVATPQVHATVDTARVGLGDTFRYTVEARAPRGERLNVVADAGPFLVAEPPKTTRSSSGDTTVVRIEQTLMCVDRGCAPGTKPRRVLLPAARATSGGASVRAQAVALTLVPRVPASAVTASRAAYRRQVDVPPASTSISPRTLAVLLAIAAVVFVALALLLVARTVPRPRAAGAWAAGGLERALRLLRESAARPAPDRRRAADYAGRAASLRGATQVVEDAERVAWAPPDPQPGDVGALAERIEAAVEGGR
jgi:hypothetical protein